MNYSAQEENPDQLNPGEEFMDEEPEYEDIQTYLSWHAAGRPYKRHSVQYFTNSALILIAVEIILFLFSQYLLMALVFSLAFLAFTLAAVPPGNLYYRISNQGIRIEDHYFIWDELYDFYFLQHYGQEVLHIRTKDYFPGELTIVLGDVPVQQVKSVLLRFLPFREYVKPTFVEKAGNWLEKNFPLENQAQ